MTRLDCEHCGQHDIPRGENIFFLDHCRVQRMVPIADKSDQPEIQSIEQDQSREHVDKGEQFQESVCLSVSEDR